MEQTLFESIIKDPGFHVILWVIVFVFVGFIVSMKDTIIKFIVLLFGLPWFSVALYQLLDRLDNEFVAAHEEFWYFKAAIPVAILIVEPILFSLFYQLRISLFRKKINAGKIAGNPNLKYGKIDKKLEEIKRIREILLSKKKPDEKGQKKLDRDLREACKERYPNMQFISALLEQGADINAADEEGLTALHLATDWLNRKTRLILFLIGAGADPNVRDKSGKTALSHYAFENRFKMGHLYALEVLTKYTDVNLQDKDGKTALFYRAGIKGENKWSFLLIKKWGADIYVKDASGKTVLDYAEEGGNRSLSSYLKKKGVGTVN